MPKKKHILDLTEAERNELVALTSKGTLTAHKMKRAQILLQVDVGRTDLEIVQGLRSGRPRVERLRQRFVEGGLPRVLIEAKRLGAQQKLDGRREARLMAEACSAPLAGHARQTLRLLAGRADWQATLANVNMANEIQDTQRPLLNHAASTPNQSPEAPTMDQR